MKQINSVIQEAKAFKNNYDMNKLLEKFEANREKKAPVNKIVKRIRNLIIKITNDRI